MKIEVLLFYLKQGREIECHFNDILYFIQPDYANNSLNTSSYKVLLYRCEKDQKDKRIFCGTPEELLNYNFDGNYQLKNNWNLFVVDYIL